MSLFRLDASIRADGSVSRALADTAERSWHAVHPHAAVVRRDVGLHPLPATAWPAAVSGLRVPAGQRTPDQAAAAALAASLAGELTGADAYLFASPLYNFGIPSHVKTWIDLVITDPRMGSAGPRPLAGRPAILVIARGGGYGKGTPRQGWDHATPYLRRILADVWGLDLRIAEAELTLAAVNPAMRALTGLAESSLHEAHAAATRHGEHVARQTRSAAMSPSA